MALRGLCRIDTSSLRTHQGWLAGGCPGQLGQQDGRFGERRNTAVSWAPGHFMAGVYGKPSPKGSPSEAKTERVLVAGRGVPQ